MYFVKYINGTQWHIVDDSQQTVFIGTRQQAEDWLDFQENARRQPAPAAVSLRQIVHALLLPFGRFVSVLWPARDAGARAGGSAGARLRLPALRPPARKH